LAMLTFALMNTRFSSRQYDLHNGIPRFSSSVAIRTFE
jgi:hypothetical protein